MHSRSRFLNNIGVVVTVALSGVAGSVAAEQRSDIPAWLQSHVGDGEGQITPVVLERARSLYLRKVAEGVVRNPCYFAMDATRPNDLSDGSIGKRFYVICEPDRSFRAISAGHGSGRDLKGVADFANARECARNFGNALDSNLTAGGAYVTGETKTSFKGYYRDSAKQYAVFIRSFVQFDGEGETANARQRAIGGHPALSLKGVCLRKDPRSPYANQNGYVPFGNLLDYSGGRSDGCTSWSPSDAQQIIPLLKEDPTTVYIYPESHDIQAVAQAMAAHQSPLHLGLYWNAYCLKQIGSRNSGQKRCLNRSSRAITGIRSQPRGHLRCVSRKPVLVPLGATEAYADLPSALALEYGAAGVAVCAH